MDFDYISAFLALKDDLLAYLYRLTANRPDAEDLAQDTYLKVTDKIGTFRGRSSFKTWVFAIATNLARDNRRVKNRWRLDVQDDCRRATEATPEYHDRIVGTFQAQPERRFEIEEHINYCFTCIAKNLPLEKQIAIILKECYDFKRTEIAGILGVTEGVVKHLLHEGRRDLQERYEQRCALVNKRGVCYQCAELNDYLQETPDAEEKIRRLGLSPSGTADENLDKRFRIINRINPLRGNGAALEDVILQILREVTGDS